MTNQNCFRGLLSKLPCYAGIGSRSDRFISLLRHRGASDLVMSMFCDFSLSGQIALDDGIVFAENEIICRNELVDGDFIVIGVYGQYLPLVFSLKSGAVGILGAGGDSHHITVDGVDLLDSSIISFLSVHAKDTLGEYSPYLVPTVYRTDASAIMKAFSGREGMSVSRASHKFRLWLDTLGIDRSFCFYETTPKTEIYAGGCTIASENEIMASNTDVRRRNNPRFVYIGSCPDGCFVVLDLVTPTPSVGYVAFMEIGDAPGWESHYVRISRSLGEFLHDSNFLGILPDDYYQAQEFGYRRDGRTRFLLDDSDYAESLCSCSSAKHTGKLLLREERLPSGESYRVFQDVGSLAVCEKTVSGILPSQCRDIWLFSTAGFGGIDYQISCIMDESEFISFAKAAQNAKLKFTSDYNLCYHPHPVCWLFNREREAMLVGNSSQETVGKRRYASFDVLQSTGIVVREYCYDRLTRTLTCYFCR